MKIKQTVKKIMLVMFFVAGFAVTGSQAPVLADCANVSTSIINCDQTGGTQAVCPDGSKIESSSTCLDGSKPDVISNSGLFGILLLAINILTAGIGVAAVGGIVYGAVLYTTAAGAPEQVKKAMEIIRNVVIGVMAYALMYAVLNFLIPGGIFT